MTRQSPSFRRGAIIGLALISCSIAAADTSSYLIFTDKDGTRMLFIFDGQVAPINESGDHRDVGGDRLSALQLLKSAVPADRVRGLTLLAGDSDIGSLRIAISMSTDESEKVRYEAEQLIADHPLAPEALRDELSEEVF